MVVQGGKQKPRFSAVAIKKLSNMLDPAVVAWSEQLTGVFELPEPVSMPLYANNFPCPTAIKATFGERLLVAGAGGSSTDSWAGYMFPDGIKTAPEQPGNVHIQTVGTGQGSATAMVGTGLHLSGAGSMIGGVIPGAGLEPTNVKCWSTFAAMLDPLFLEETDTPTVVPNTGSGPSGLTRRCVAFGMRFTYMGKLADTEGRVQVVLPYETPITTSSANADFMDKYKTDASFRSFIFGTGARTHCYYWTPTCEDIEFGSVPLGGTPSSVLGASARLLWVANGFVAGDKLLVEYLLVEEIAGQRVISVQKNRHASPDTTHVLNALGSRPNNITPISGTKAPVQLHHHAAGLKIATHPWLHNLLEDASGYVKSVGHAAQIAKEVGQVAGKVFSLFG
jgi:hypothetical protein